jgi:predicted nucleic acid-binding protein
MDLWIAATALSLGLILYTRDREGFVPLAGLIEIKMV